MTVTLEEVDDLLVEVEKKRDLYTQALNDVMGDESIDEDDKAIEVCRRLAIVVLPPQIHDDDMGIFWCDVCGSVVANKEKHGRWHLRIQATTKLAYWVAALTFKHTALLGMTLSLTLEIIDEDR